MILSLIQFRQGWHQIPACDVPLKLLNLFSPMWFIALPCLAAAINPTLLLDQISLNLYFFFWLFNSIVDVTNLHNNQIGKRGNFWKKVILNPPVIRDWNQWAVGIPQQKTPHMHIKYEVFSDDVFLSGASYVGQEVIKMCQRHGTDFQLMCRLRI